jgi:hypothetical protein
MGLIFWQLHFLSVRFEAQIRMINASCLLRTLASLMLPMFLLQNDPIAVLISMWLFPLDSMF